MPNEETTETAMVEVETTETPAPEATADDTTLGDAGKRALDNERTARREAERKLSEATAKLQEIEDASKSELELAVERAKRFEDQYNALAAESIRNEVALTKGLTPAQAKRLVGTTREELEADAADLLASFSAPASPEQETPPAHKPGLLKASPGTPDPAVSEREAIAAALFKV